MARRRARYSGNTIEIDPIIRLWLLRILVPLGGHREFLHSHGFHNDALATALGLGHWVDSSQFDIPDFTNFRKNLALKLIRGCPSMAMRAQRTH